MKKLKNIPDHDKYITIKEFDKLTAVNFFQNLKQTDLESKNDVADFLKKTYLF